MVSCGFFLFPKDFKQNSLRSSPVEFTVKDSLPGAEIQLAAGLPWAGQAVQARGDGHHHLAPHYLALDVGVGVILAGVVANGGIGRPAHEGPAAPASARSPGWKRPGSSSLMKTEAVDKLLGMNPGCFDSLTLVVR